MKHGRAAIKNCHCFNYQAGQEGYETSEAKELVNEIINSATCKLPGYGEAAWGE